MIPDAILVYKFLILMMRAFISSMSDDTIQLSWFVMSSFAKKTTDTCIFQIDISVTGISGVDLSSSFLFNLLDSDDISHV